jgi:hypothetical protein
MIGVARQPGRRMRRPARLFIVLEAGTATGTSGTLPGNAYTSPGDHAHNQAWVKGSYPRL